MEALDLLSFMNTTYGLIIALKNNIQILDGTKIDKRSLIALTDTLEQNIYNIKVEYECLLNIQWKRPL